MEERHQYDDTSRDKNFEFLRCLGYREGTLIKCRLQTTDIGEIFSKMGVLRNDV